MPDKKEEKYIRLHGIQLRKVNVSRLSIKALREPDPESGAFCEDIPITVGHTNYDPDDNAIWISLRTEIGKDEDSDSPYEMVVEIVGEFTVDEDKFPIEHIVDWARRNAPMILQPYLREQVYSLTLRCGFKPLILPLIQVPTLTKRDQ